MPKITGGILGTKAVSLGDLDNFLDWLVNEGDGAGPQELYRAVAWTFWCVNLRANNIAQVPYVLYPMDLPVADETEDNTVEWDIDLAQMLWEVEAWLSLKAAAYVLKRENQVVLTDLQVLNANTMKVLAWDAEGPTVFRQKVGAAHKDYPAEEIIYFRTFNPKDDINEGVSSGEVAQLVGMLIYYANKWASKFFENGAIPAVMLTTDGPVPPLEKERIQAAWVKKLKSVANAFRTVVLERGLKPTVIGMPVKDLAMPELERVDKEQILAAHMIPPGLAEAKTNRAERDSLREELWTDALIPELVVRIGPTLNEQLFSPLGLRIKFLTGTIEVLQKAELEKAESSAFMINGVMMPAYEANVVSVDETRAVISKVLAMADMPKLDATFTPEERAPVVPFGGAAGGADNEGPGNPTPPGENAGANTRPKAPALEWGAHRVSLQNLDDGEPKLSSAGDRATLTAT